MKKDQKVYNLRINYTIIAAQTFITAFVLLICIATYSYTSQTGVGWTQVFWCDLFDATTQPGHINIACFISWMAFVSFCMGMFCFWITLPYILKSQLVKTIMVLGCGSIILAPTILIPGFHDGAIYLVGIPGLMSVCGLLFLVLASYLPRSFKMIWSCAFLAAIVNFGAWSFSLQMTVVLLAQKIATLLLIVAVLWSLHLAKNLSKRQ